MLREEARAAGMTISDYVAAILAARRRTASIRADLTTLVDTDQPVTAATRPLNHTDLNRVRTERSPTPRKVTLAGEKGCRASTTYEENCNP